DSDGHHITTLLLTFFYRHLPELIKQRRIFVGVPPLYRIDIEDAALFDELREVPVEERSEEHTSELQSLTNLVCRLLLAKKQTTLLKEPLGDHRRRCPGSGLVSLRWPCHQSPSSGFTILF